MLGLPLGYDVYIASCTKIGAYGLSAARSDEYVFANIQVAIAALDTLSLR